MIFSKRISGFLFPTLWLFLLGLTFFHAPLRAADKPRHLIKLATLVPEGSSWVQMVRNIDSQIRQETGGEVGLKIYAGGVQGDDDVVLRKMRIGQLQAAGFTGQGITTIFPDILALEMPFLYNGYEEVDYVLGQMEDFYRQGLAQKGFVLLGWSDIGFVHILSKHPIRGVKDIHKRKVWRLEGEPITQVLFRKAGVISAPLNIPDVLLGLQTNMVDVVYAPPAAAIVMQWFTRVKYITELPINYTLGALLVDKRTFDKLTAEHQEILLRIADEELTQLTEKTRRENEEAMQVMLANGLQLVSPLPPDVETFKQLVADSVPELVGKSFSREAYDLVQMHLNAFRQERSQGE